MLTLDQCELAARELLEGTQAPSLKLALWAAALSPQKSIEYNGLQVDVLRPFVNAELPSQTKYGLAGYIRKRAPGMVYTQHTRSLLIIEELDNTGELDRFKRKPQTLREWIAWRKALVKIPGISWKTASFTALLMWPLDCPFVPVDSHVCGRFNLTRLYKSGVLSKKTRTGYSIYRTIENMVRAEWKQAGMPSAVCVWHWFKWEQHRQDTGYAHLGSAPVSHSLLSARVY